MSCHLGTTTEHAVCQCGRRPWRRVSNQQGGTSKHRGAASRQHHAEANTLSVVVLQGDLHGQQGAADMLGRLACEQAVVPTEQVGQAALGWLRKGFRKGGSH